MANRFWINGTGTWDAVSTSNWGAASGTTTLSTVPGTTDAVIFDAASGGGLVTVATTIAVQSITLSAFTGGTLDFATNNNNVTLTTSVVAFSDSGTGVHTLNMGNGTWTINGTSSPGNVIWNSSNANLTLAANSSNLVFASNQTLYGAQIRFGGKTFNTVSITGAGKWHFSSSTATFANLNLNGGQAILLLSNATFTISTAPTWSGTITAPIVLVSENVITGTILSVSTGTVSLDWGILCGINGTGGAAYSATNSIGYSTNNNWTISAPSAASGGGVIIGG